MFNTDNWARALGVAVEKAFPQDKGNPLPTEELILMELKRIRKGIWAIYGWMAFIGVVLILALVAGLLTMCL